MKITIENYGRTHTTEIEGDDLSIDEYKVPGDSVTAYWNYYEAEKVKIRNSNEEIRTRPNYARN